MTKLGRQIPVIAALDNGAGQWRLGEPVTASISLAGGSEGQGVTRVPTSAIQMVAGRTVVFVRTPKGFQATGVVIGDAADDSVIVRSGLKGGERVATNGSFTLKAELGKSEAGHEEH